MIPPPGGSSAIQPDEDTVATSTSTHSAQPTSGEVLPGGMTPLRHPLTATLRVATEIWTRVGEDRTGDSVDDQRLVLDTCRQVLHAECLALVEVTGAVTVRVGECPVGEADLARLAGPVIGNEDLLRWKGPFGLSRVERLDGDDRLVTVIPITLNASLNTEFVPANAVLVAVDPPAGSGLGVEIDEPMGRVIAALLWAVGLTRDEAADAGLDPSKCPSGEDLECVVLDSLRRIYAGVPWEAYNRRFELYEAQLSSLWFAFQPIYRISRGAGVDVYGWEALARMGTREGFPRWLFGVADTWGNRFKVQLDLEAMNKASQAFRTQVKLSGLEDEARLRYLAINVHPSTVAVEEYQSAVLAAAAELGGTTLMLELSEREGFNADPELIDHIDIRPRQARPDRQMKTQLQPLQRQGVKIAIDDFGVQEGSVIRALDTRASVLKLDRALVISEADDAAAVFQFAAELALRFNAEVVAEGVDSVEQLRALWQAGITLIQAWMFTEGSTTLGLPTAQESERIRALVREAQEG